jgi:hypothetical protein
MTIPHTPSVSTLKLQHPDLQSSNTENTPSRHDVFVKSKAVTLLPRRHQGGEEI